MNMRSLLYYKARHVHTEYILAKFRYLILLDVSLLPRGKLPPYSEASFCQRARASFFCAC